METYLSRYYYEQILDAIILKMGSIKPENRPEDWEQKYQQMLDFKKWFERQVYVNVEIELLRTKFLNVEKQLMQKNSRA